MTSHVKWDMIYIRYCTRTQTHNLLTMTKPEISKWKLAKVGYLPDDVGKQPSIP